MATRRRLTLAVALGCLLLCSLAPDCASGGSVSQNDGNIDAFSAGGRHLQQLLTPCPHDWAYDNFTNLEDSCPYQVNISVNYPKQQCCEALAAMLCPYRTLLEDPTSACDSDFFETLSVVAPNYTSNFFGFICTDPNQPNGIPCPSNTTTTGSPNPSPNSTPGQGSHSFVLTILLAVAVFEILVLLF